MYEARQIEGQLHLNERVRRHTAEKPSWNRTEAGAAKANPTQPNPKGQKIFFCRRGGVVGGRSGDHASGFS